MQESNKRPLNQIRIRKGSIHKNKLVEGRKQVSKIGSNNTTSKHSDMNIEVRHEAKQETDN